MKSRPTFEVLIGFDLKPDGLRAWKWIHFYNGFNISFGFLGLFVRIQFVKNNYN